MCARCYKVEEESLFKYLMDDHSNLERVPSMSDVASVNSDESIGPTNPITTPGLSTNLGKHLSKSPSLEVGAGACDEVPCWRVSVQFSSVQFGSVQFSSVQFNLAQFSLVLFSLIQFSSFSSFQFSSFLFSLI